MRDSDLDRQRAGGACSLFSLSQARAENQPRRPILVYSRVYYPHAQVDSSAFITAHSF